MSGANETGEEGFLVGLRRCDCETRRQGDVIVFSVTPVAGRYGGQRIETGVSAQEVAAWPSVPPHWVHLPVEVSFANSNSQPSTIDGWLRHSRSISNWGNARDPVQAWLAHVRAVLEED